MQQAESLSEYLNDPDNAEVIEERNKKIGIANMGHPDYTTPEGIKKAWQGIKAQWTDPNSTYNDPEFIARRARAIGKALTAKPNGWEKEFIELFPALQFTGDFNFWVGSKNPDFILPNTNLCIDLFGDYWHPDRQEEYERMQYFQEHGYRLLVIWQSEWRTDREPIQPLVREIIGKELGGVKIRYRLR